jgi:hypothetical protein
VESENLSMPLVLDALARATRQYPYERKVLVCRKRGIGRELLRTLAVRGVPWTNWEITTSRQLAHSMMAGELSADRLGATDEFDELALLDASIDAVLEGQRGRLAELAEGTGLRQAVARSVQALRLAGIGPTQLERARFRDEDKRAQIARILAEYEHRLRQPFTDSRGTTMQGRVDAADVYVRVTDAISLGRALDARIFIMADHTRRGLPGKFIDVLIEGGAIVLPDEPVFGMARPAWWLEQSARSADDAMRGGATALSWLHDVTGWSRAANRAHTSDARGSVVLEVFAATSVSAELREVLRRVIAAQLRWDEVEIVATDAEAYGVALDAMAQRLGIPVSYSMGLPLARTRPGRAVGKYLEWVEQGYPADVLRQMLERGDILAPDTDVSGTAIARQLRSMKIGRGRERYESALAARERTLEYAQSAQDERTPEEFADDRARERREISALAAVVRPLIATAPELPHSAIARDATMTASALARGVIALLALVPATTSVDRTACRRMDARLRRIAETATRRTTLRGAIAMLVSKLEDRVPAPEVEGPSPWTSSGGYLHLSDLEHGGFAGRRATFIVGLDAARFPGGGSNDALLVDDDRRRLTHGQHLPALPTAADRIDERRYAFGNLVARLRGRVTFSYPTWDAVEGRANTPSSELLQAYRLLSGDATADYEQMHRSIQPAASAVPRGSALLDVDDVWLHALSHNGALRRGVDAVCAAYPNLRAGVDAWKIRLRSDAATPYHGMIAPREALDPRDKPNRTVSPTQLQVLGTCPHRYLMRYVLRVKKPDDPEFSPEQWLSPIDKGSLLHDVYQRALEAARDDGIDIASDGFEVRVLQILDDQIERMRVKLPPPGESVFRLEYDNLREDVRAFVAMVREDDREFIAYEMKFGEGGAQPVELALPDGRTLKLTGRIDRVDRLADGSLVVVDYKTGSSFTYTEKSRVYDGGRRLQHALYAKAAEQLFGARVARAEYHFPSRKSQNHRAKYEAAQLRDGMILVSTLLDFVANGWFIPTNAPDDCKFCDYALACRTNVDPYGKVVSAMAEWSREADDDAIDMLRLVRR